MPIKFTKKAMVNRILMLSFVILPYFLLKHFWPAMVERIPTESLKRVFPLMMQATAFVLLFAFYIPVYYYAFPAIEKYKSNSIPWPWKENPKTWPHLRNKLIFYYLRNILFLAPLLGRCVHSVTRMSYSLETFPSL